MRGKAADRDPFEAVDRREVGGGAEDRLSAAFAV
jgi:hypothetical protein